MYKLHVWHRITVWCSHAFRINFLWGLGPAWPALGHVVEAWALKALGRIEEAAIYFSRPHKLTWTHVISREVLVRTHIPPPKKRSLRKLRFGHFQDGNCLPKIQGATWREQKFSSTALHCSLPDLHQFSLLLEGKLGLVRQVGYWKDHSCAGGWVESSEVYAKFLQLSWGHHTQWCVFVKCNSSPGRRSKMVAWRSFFVGEQSWKRSAVETAVIQAISDDGEALQLHMQQEPDDLVMRAKAEFLNAMVPLVAM